MVIRSTCGEISRIVIDRSVLHSMLESYTDDEHTDDEQSVLHSVLESYIGDAFLKDHGDLQSPPRAI